MKNMTLHQNGLKLRTYEEEGEARMNVRFPAFFTEGFRKKHRNVIRKIADYTANQLQARLLTDAAALFDEMKLLGFDMPSPRQGVSIHHQNGDACIRPSLFDGRIDIQPYIEFSDADEYGFTLVPGHFSDFIIDGNADGKLIGYTKDFSSFHFGIASMYLMKWMTSLEDILVNGKEVPSDFERFSADYLLHLDKEILSIKEGISEQIEARLHRNEGKDTDDAFVRSLLLKYNVSSRFMIFPTTRLQLALEIGKPIEETNAIIEKIIS